MAFFSYKGRNSRGALIQGELEAPSLDAVAGQLLNNDITPIEINERPERRESIDVLAFLRNRPPGLDDLVMFSRQMYTLMRAGVPLVRSFVGLQKSTRNAHLVEAQKDILENVESGRDLSSSIARHPDIFSTLFVSMVRVGEETGRLEESFLRISEYLEREKETRERIKAAVRYPIFVIAALVIAIGVLNYFVIPAFAEIFERARVPLPWQTQVLIGTSSFFVAWWPLILGGIAAAVVGFVQYTKTENGRYKWDRLKLRLPLIGNIIHRATLGRFSRAMAMALTSGVPLIQALTVVSRSVDNEYLAEHILNMRNGIERGDSITRTATITGMFTPLVLQMLAVGEETGAVDQMLEEVADFYDREVDYDIKNLSSAIEPILIVAISIMVLILALGIFIPMWDLSKVMG